MTIADYLASPFLADPLRLFDSCLISDGGAAFVTTSVERARDLPRPPAVVAGVGEGFSASGTHWAEQREFTSTPQVFSAPGAFTMAGIRPEDVDVLTVYDPITVVSLMQIEDMGFCAKGGRGVRGGTTLHHDAGRLPFNTHGGCFARVRARIAHVVECVKQLRGRPPPMPDCEVGVRQVHGTHGERSMSQPRRDVAIQRADFPLPDAEARRGTRQKCRRVRCDDCGRYVHPADTCPGAGGAIAWPQCRTGTLISWAVVARSCRPRRAGAVRDRAVALKKIRSSPRHVRRRRRPGDAARRHAGGRRLPSVDVPDGSRPGGDRPDVPPRPLITLLAG
jgi:hypothetical protein